MSLSSIRVVVVVVMVVEVVVVVVAAAIVARLLILCVCHCVGSGYEIFVTIRMTTNPFF